jgi:hypothetical protein
MIPIVFLNGRDVVYFIHFSHAKSQMAPREIELNRHIDRHSKLVGIKMITSAQRKPRGDKIALGTEGQGRCLFSTLFPHAKSQRAQNRVIHTLLGATCRLIIGEY